MHKHKYVNSIFNYVQYIRRYRNAFEMIGKLWEDDLLRHNFMWILLNLNRLSIFESCRIRESRDWFGARRKNLSLKHRQFVLERNLHTRRIYMHLSFTAGDATDKTPLRSAAMRLASSPRVARRNSHAVCAYMRVQTRH